MKKSFKFIFILLFFMVMANSIHATETIQFNESVLPYKGGLLISNNGFNTLGEETNKAKGYILYSKRGKTTQIIKPGYLQAPAGLSVYKNKLFVCDYEKLWIFDLKETDNKPETIYFSPEDKVINDVVVSDDTLYVTVTNSDRIYKINLKSKTLKPELWLNVPSPNGIAIKNNTIYVVSIPKDYATIEDENVVYIIKDRNHPVLEKLNDTPGLYDGVCVSKDNKTIYVSDWATSSIKSIDIKTKETNTIYHKEGLTPADIVLKGNKLFIPDMVNHRVIILNLKTLKEYSNL